MAVKAWAKEAQVIMKRKGLTQRELISVFEVSSQGGVSHYFAGRYDPSNEQLRKLANTLDVDSDHFIKLEEKMSSQLRIDPNVLTEAFQTIARHNEMSERDITKFFSVYEKMNPQQVAEIYDILMAQKEKTDFDIQNTVRKYAK